jgi:phosphohistidine phosphatase
VSTRRLVVMRHGSAEPYGTTDQTRGLTDRGRDEAAAAARFLASHGLVPDHAAVSSAIRTQETWAVVREHSGSEADAQIERMLYNAEPETALEVLRLTPAEARTLLYLGHNPTASFLCSALDSGEGDPKALGELMTSGFPPAAVAVFEYGGEWTDLDLGAARLVECRVRD